MKSRGIENNSQHLRFREREIGFLIITNCDYHLEHPFLFETLNALRTSMEALYARLTPHKMNKQLYIRDSLTGLCAMER